MIMTMAGRDVEEKSNTTFSSSLSSLSAPVSPMITINSGHCVDLPDKLEEVREKQQSHAKRTIQKELQHYHHHRSPSSSSLSQSLSLLPLPLLHLFLRILRRHIQTQTNTNRDRHRQTDFRLMVIERVIDYPAGQGCA